MAKKCLRDRLHRSRRIDRRLLAGCSRTAVRRCPSSRARCIHRDTDVERCAAGVRRYIEGYSARLNPARLGLGLLAYVEVLLDRTRRSPLSAQAGDAGAREVMECHIHVGEQASPSLPGSGARSTLDVPGLQRRPLEVGVR